ncbi:MAG: carbamate kinase [Candidatus Micrarchaeota archaeon]|nr:carbamate kinase [Candidatus Micrarchaeota archaeon]
METIVIALGGNALLNPSGRQSYAEGQRNMARVARSIVSIARGHRVVVTHGNGTQVGDELVRNISSKGEIDPLPLYAMTAETQGTIGSEIALALGREARLRGIGMRVGCVLTHVVVSPRDPSFSRPAKPIGPTMALGELKRYRMGGMGIAKSKGGYRLTVASPRPREILELDAIRDLSRSGIVVACGGGGVPVVRRGSSLQGAAAVIDKDSTTRLLANSLGAGTMLILTDAGYVYADYPKNKWAITEMPASSMKRFADRFEAGSIRPKVEAAVEFVENGGKEARIGNLFELDGIMKGRSGTRVY